MCLFLFFLNRHPPGSTLFPYTTLFRSDGEPDREARRRRGEHDAQRGDVVACCAQQPAPARARGRVASARAETRDRKSTRLNSSHVRISYAVFCLKQKIPILPFAPQNYA